MYTAPHYTFNGGEIPFVFGENHTMTWPNAIIDNGEPDFADLMRDVPNFLISTPIVIVGPLAWRYNAWQSVSTGYIDAITTEDKVAIEREVGRIFPDAIFIYTNTNLYFDQAPGVMLNIIFEQQEDRRYNFGTCVFTVESRQNNTSWSFRYPMTPQKVITSEADNSTTYEVYALMPSAWVNRHNGVPSIPEPINGNKFVDILTPTTAPNGHRVGTVPTASLLLGRFHMQSNGKYTTFTMNHDHKNDNPSLLTNVAGYFKGWNEMQHIGKFNGEWFSTLAFEGTISKHGAYPEIGSLNGFNLSVNESVYPYT